MTTKKYYQEHREQIRQYSKKYRQEHKEHSKEYNKKYYQQHKEKSYNVTREYKKAHRKELNEHHRLRYHTDEKFRQHILARKLAQKVPISSNCSKCGSTENLERHHSDYSKPLKVITLCQSCNNKEG